MPQEQGRSLELGQDLTFQRREWIVQRVGWVLMALLIVAALLGLFATGPLSGTSATTDDGLQIEYGRFARHEAFTALQLEISPEVVQDGEIQIRASQSFLDTWSIESIMPEPDSTTLESDGVTWIFSANDLTEPGLINLRVKPEVLGFGRGEIGLASGELLTIRQFIYP